MTHRNSTTYQTNFSWNDGSEEWLKTFCIGRTLNFPCGVSKVGDIRADIDPQVKPDIVADFFDPFKTFKEGEFDTVICDPPYKVYVSGKNRFRWENDIGRLAKKRVMFSTPLVRLKIVGNWKKSYYINEQGGALFLRVWQIFDRVDSLTNINVGVSLDSNKRNERGASDAPAPGE